jgi:hypothetical protein
VVAVGTAEAVGSGGVAVSEDGVIARAVGGGKLEVGNGGVDVGAATPEQAEIANAATSVVAPIERICSPSWGAPMVWAHTHPTIEQGEGLAGNSTQRSVCPGRRVG